MHIHFEPYENTKSDCSILSLSWMGKVPEYGPTDDGWKLNRTNYYSEGWLASGNMRGIVGVTFTTSQCRKNLDPPDRTNFNLRGHRSDVILVKWNEPYQKLASCDSSGIIFVWIKYEGRWSIELINDRNTPVTNFSWSHDGRMALICYQDGFVLVGSVAGQRYWSSMLNLQSTITCGIWTPDDQQVYFGTTQGLVIVMDVHGAMVAQMQLCNDVAITSMAWSCEKFKMEESEESEPGVTNASKRTFVLAVCFQNGLIYLLKSYDDVSPAHINTGFNGILGIKMEWSNSREILAVAGSSQSPLLDSEGAPIYDNILKFYTETGHIMYQARIPNTSAHVSALTWGHNDKRLFVATGAQVHVAWVSKRLASLQMLCRLQVLASVGSEKMVPLLPLPFRMQIPISNLFAQTIRSYVPALNALRNFVTRPPVTARLHCTMIRHDDESNGTANICYTLYLEYLGGLLPLLKGKRTSKMRPEFVIFDPQENDSPIFFQYSPDSKSSSGSSQSTTGNSGRTDSSDSELDDHCRSSPRTPRKRKLRQKKRIAMHYSDRAAFLTTSSNPDSLDELAYVDTLPEDGKLVEITSNIWGTKFKFHGLAPMTPAYLGEVIYKTSLLHLQPRQMMLVVKELRTDNHLEPKDPFYNPHAFSEDDDYPVPINCGMKSEKKKASTSHISERAAPIAPMSPAPNYVLERHKNSLNGNGNGSTDQGIGRSPLAKAESYDEDSSNESLESVSINDSAKPSTSTAATLHSPLASSKIPRPKNITASTPGARAGPGPGYSSFKNNYSSRSSSNSCSCSRHAISPLYSDGSVPTLQSPKNAVAPTDIIFERPPISSPGQTTLMSYSSNADYANNVVHVKNALTSDAMRTTNNHVNPVPLNLNLNLERMDAKLKSNQPSTSKKRDILFIDDEWQFPTQHPHGLAAPANQVPPTPFIGEIHMKRTSTVVSIAPVQPDSMTRSCSVGYLDSTAITPSEEALSALRKDAPNKRLILVDKRNKRKKRHNHEDVRKAKLQQSGKSKSLDSCDLFSNQTKLTKKEQENVMRKLQEISESSTCSSVDNTLCFKCRNNMNANVPCKRCQPTSPQSHAAAEHDITKKHEPEQGTEIAAVPSSQTVLSNNNNHKLGGKQQPQQKTTMGNETPTPTKKRFDVITSFTDSPLFTRKYRFGAGSRNKDPDATPLLGRKNENGFNLIKQLSEVRWRRKEAQNNTYSIETSTNAFSDAKQDQSQQTECSELEVNGNGNGNTIEATPVEAKASVSLHTQALTTLENIISRLRDLDEGHLTPHDEQQRLPRSSPASPAASKKNKRYQSSSPIRNLLNSPLLNRRLRNKKPSFVESSDDEGNLTNGSGEEYGDDEVNARSKQYRDLETFQKAQLKQKLKRVKAEPITLPEAYDPNFENHRFVMFNRAPTWNELNQVYQLDFGGRVTQESAKNFQMEFQGRQVMQFGRIDSNAYTLDFEFPFTPIQAFAVALANVTQRLK